MNIREPHHFTKIREQRQAKHRHRRLRRALQWSMVGVIIVALITYGLYVRPLPKIDAKTIQPVITAEQVALSWPAKGQAAIGVPGQGVMAETANQQPVPTASVAKVMLALAVLKKYPLQPGQPGPLVPITQVDVDLYNRYLSMDGAVTKVAVGEQINLYQALQATLLPSGNNMADTLAVWAYGSMAEYHQAANRLGQELGMTQSKFAGDASGFLPETVSTTRDLVMMGQAAVENPVLKEIMAQPSAVIPVANEIRSTNFMLGQAGIFGIKSGNTEQAGGCFLFAAERQLPSGQKVTAVGAILGAESFVKAATGSAPLLNSFYQGFSEVVVVPKGTVVARYSLPWGGETAAVTTKDTSVLAWRGAKATITIEGAALRANQSAGSPAGLLVAKTAFDEVQTPLNTTVAVDSPAWQWRITRN